jgi:hypothetical protein
VQKKELDGDTNIEFLSNSVTKLQEILEQKECDEALYRHDISEFQKTSERMECLKKETEARLRRRIASLEEKLKQIVSRTNGSHPVWAREDVTRKRQYCG